MSIHIDIKKEFKDFSLEANFQNNDGTLGILGPSGCGKSLTLKCLAGLETPDEGIIKVGDKVVFDSAAGINIKPQERNVGYLFQSYALFPNMTVEENIRIAMKPDMENKEEKFKTLINRYELGGFENRYPVNLSGGQQQRVALARIFAYEPEILLLDEPFSALDTYLRENMQAELLDVIDEYEGDVIMVTHSRDEAYKICDRLLVLNDGGIIGDNTPEQLFANPVNVDTARITGCKNISPIKKISENRVYAVNWDAELEVNEPVGDAEYIGIRAHNFSVCGPNDQNCIRVESANEMVGPFEKTIIFKTSNYIDNGNDDNHNNGQLWWICPKNTDVSNIKYVSINKDSIYLLAK